MWRLKTRASGHDFGQGNNCAEFCYNTHSVKVNNKLKWVGKSCRNVPTIRSIHKEVLGFMTALVGAPGQRCEPKNFELTPLVHEDDVFSVEYDVTHDPHGNYRMEGQIIGYGAPNMVHDVELMDILSPNDDKLKSRFNPVCERSVVLIRNTGSEPLNRVTFTYGITGADLVSTTIELDSSMVFLETREIALPYDAMEYVVGDDEALLEFEVRAEASDGLDDSSNGWMSRPFVVLQPGTTQTSTTTDWWLCSEQMQFLPRPALKSPSPMAFTGLEVTALPTRSTRTSLR